MGSTRLSAQEVEKLMPTICAAMKHFAFPYTAAIYGVFDEDYGELVGSGTFVRLLNETFILTAMHVAAMKLARETDGSLKYVGLAHSTASGSAPRALTAPCFTWGHPYDLCLIPVDSRVMGDRKPVSVDLLANDATEADNDIVFVQGFPVEKSRPLFGVHSDTCPYVTTLGESTGFDWFEPRLHLAIDYAPTGLKDEAGNPANFVDPHGMSGSAIWATGRTRTGDDWAPSQARIVGVVHNWDQKAGSLVGTRIEIVREFLLCVLRSRCAYGRWESRGRPANDDWDDWFEAVRTIPGLS